MVSAFLLQLGTWEWAIIIFAVIALLLIIPFAIIDTGRSPNLTTMEKILWILFILIAPYLGAVVYLFWGRKQKAL